MTKSSPVSRVRVAADRCHNSETAGTAARRSWYLTKTVTFQRPLIKTFQTLRFTFSHVISIVLIVLNNEHKCLTNAFVNLTERTVLPTDVLGVINASGVINLGTVPLLLLPEFDRKSEGAGSGAGRIFLRSVWEPLPDSLSELWSVRLSENPAGEGAKKCEGLSVTDNHSVTL